MKKLIRRREIVLGIIGICFLLLAQALSAPKPSQPTLPQETEAPVLPLSGKIIFVDAGHGGADGGAKAQDSGRWEKEINLSVAQKLKSVLESSGARVVMSRETDMEYDTNKRSDLSARLSLAQDQGAQMVISIHMNEYRSRAESGPQVFYRKNQEEGRLLAGVLQEHLIKTLEPVKKRAAMAGDYFILSSSLPSVLVECGFLSNAAEEKLLLSEDYQQKIAQAVRDGIIAYFALPIHGE